MRRKGALVLVASLRRYGAGEGKDAVVTKEACAALRSVTLGDDRRKDFSGVRRVRYTATNSISGFFLRTMFDRTQILLYLLLHSCSKRAAVSLFLLQGSIEVTMVLRFRLILFRFRRSHTLGLASRVEA